MRALFPHAIDPAKGTLTLVQFASTRGKEPRGMAIDPTGKLLFAANQKSDNMLCFTLMRRRGN